MSSVWTVKEKSQGELVVSISGDAWKNAQKKALDKLVKNFKIDGFRQGKAPLPVVRKHISDDQVRMEAADSLAGQEYQQALKEHNIEPIARPTLDVKKIDAEEVELVFTVTVRPEVKVGEYKGLKLVVEAVEVADADVDHEIEHILENNVELVLKEGDDAAVEKGDIAVIDFEGFVDDVAFEGGKGENYPLEIGSGSFIPGFEDQLIGVKAGKKKTVKVKFPESYGAEHLAGKNATFKCKVNEIKQKETPELTEEIVADLHIEGVNTPAELRDHIKANLLSQKESRAKTVGYDQLLDSVVKGSEVEIPEVMVQEESDQLMIEFSERLKQSGYSLDLFMQQSGKTEEEVKETMWEDAENRVKTRLVLEAIAVKEGLKVTPEEVNAEYAVMAKQYGMEEARVRQLAHIDYVSYDLVLRKASNLIKESSIV